MALKRVPQLLKRRRSTLKWLPPPVEIMDSGFHMAAALPRMRAIPRKMLAAPIEMLALHDKMRAAPVEMLALPHTMLALHDKMRAAPIEMLALHHKLLATPIEMLPRQCAASRAHWVLACRGAALSRVAWNFAGVGVSPGRGTLPKPSVRHRRPVVVHPLVPGAFGPALSGSSRKIVPGCRAGHDRAAAQRARRQAVGGACSGFRAPSC